MRLSASIDLLMQLAAQEAIASDFREIEPEHLLEGVLKLSELPVQELDKIAPGANAARELAAEVSVIRAELERRVINSTQTRRNLREQVGKGKTPYEGGHIHRSRAAREVFEAAAQLANKAGTETLSAGHLLEVLLVSPTDAIVNALGGVAGLRPRNPVGTPFLNEYGRYVASESIAQGIVDSLKAECRALIHSLSLKNRRCVFLISDNDNLVFSVVHASAAVEGPQSLKGRRVLDLTALNPVGKEREKSIERLSQALVEATTKPEVILFLPAIDLSQRSNKEKQWADLLKTTLASGSAQCICRVGQEAYQSWIKKDSTWKRLAHTIWIRERTKRVVPSEL